MRKIERTKSELQVMRLERRARRKFKKTKEKVVAGYTMFLGVVILLGLGFVLARSWMMTHTVTFVNPIHIKVIPTPTVKISSPVPPGGSGGHNVYPTSQEAGSSANKRQLNMNLTERELVMALPLGVKLWNMYQLETQRGKTDFCRNEGRGFGGWGVKNDKGEIHCYPTFKEAAVRANYWLTKNLRRHNGELATTLCEWSGHGITNDCTYYKNFMTL